MRPPRGDPFTRQSLNVGGSMYNGLINERKPMSKMNDLALITMGCYQETLSDGTTYWVSPQCAECGEVEHADTLIELGVAMDEHACSYC